MFFILISFVAGVLTVLAPCVLPLLPVIVGGTLSGTEKRRKSKPYIIAGSLALSVIVFTLILKASTVFIGVPEIFWKIVSGVIVIVFGLSLLFPHVWEKVTIKFNLLISRKSNKVLATGVKKESFWGDVIIGAALGPVFSSCSPTYFVILATVLPASFLLGLINLTAYAVGLGGALLIIGLLGERLVSKLEWVSNPDGYFKRGLGIVFLIVGVAVIAGLDKKFQTYVIAQGIFDPAKLEEKLIALSEGKEEAKKMIEGGMLTKEMKEKTFEKYKEIKDPAGFVNSDKPFTLAELVGKKVILLDIVTYSCINCQRTFPYLNSWHEKYNDRGLQIVAIHTPEFAFEKDIDNVREAMKKFGIKFPVVLDNNYSTWNAYGNRYWPRKYLIDIDGYIRYDHIGEGAYEETEGMIKKLLLERAESLGVPKVEDEGLASTNIKETQIKSKSPETYFGAWRNTNFGNGESGEKGTKSYTLPQTLKDNNFYLSGTFKVEQEFIESMEDTSSLHFNYEASKVFIVAESATDKKIKVFKDGLLVKEISVKDAGLYTLIEKEDTHKGSLRIVVPSGVKLYTFTFG